MPAKFLVSIRSHLAMVGSKLAGIPTLTLAKLPSSYQSNATRSGPTKKNPLRASETLCRCLFGTGLQASSSILRINPPAIRVLQYARGKAGPCTSRSEPSLASFARDLRTQGVCGFSSGPQSVPDGRGRAEAKKRNWQPRPPVTIRRALASRNGGASMLAGLWLPMKLLAPLCPALCVLLYGIRAAAATGGPARCGFRAGCLWVGAAAVYAVFLFRCRINLSEPESPTHFPSYTIGLRI